MHKQMNTTMSYCSVLRIGFLMVVFAATGFAQTPGEPTEGAATDSKSTQDAVTSFEKQVRPLLISKCFECHSQETERNGGLAVDSLESMIQGGDSGPALRLESSDESLILRAVRYRDPKLQMPPDGRLSASEIKILEDWISHGAQVPSNFQKRAPATIESKSMALQVPRAREHWAYRPIEPARLPSNGHLNPIDAWIAKRCEELHVEPSPLVDDRTWIRRLAIDLHGLNPTYEQTLQGVELLSGLNGPAEHTARAQLVDRYLESPRYGERFARHWMDVVRYAESLTLRGFVLPDVWRYRNYLIDSFNRDRPFDQMILEQIAGDLLDDTQEGQVSIQEQQRRRVATTFWAIGDHNYEEQDKKQLEMDAVDEQIEVFGRAFLAQTLGCARCHDHKFDPIPTADYYALAGILKSSVSMEHENVSKWIRVPLPLPVDQEQQYRGLENQLADLKKELAVLKQQLKSGGSIASIVRSDEARGTVVDDKKAKKIGAWKESNSVKSYVDDGYLHDENKLQGNKSVTFEPPALPSGSYLVRLSYAHGENRSSKTAVRVFSADGETLIVVNQRKPASEEGLWHPLGKFRFEKDGACFVIVSNDDADGHVIADAVQFLPENDDPTAQSTATASSDKQQETLKKTLEGLEKKQSDLQRQLDSRPMVITIRPEKSPADIPIHIRGSVHRLGEVVPRGFLSCINSHEPQLDRRIRIQPTANGRLELAQWLVAPENPLTARVYVNRIWSHLMGQGIVPTIDNFGTTGQHPSDPQLLDWLAWEFMAQGWSTKWLVRTIVTSDAYRRSLSVSQELLNQDPENTFFLRASLRRLDSESIRDSMLQATGELQMGATVESTIRKGTSADYRYEHEIGLRTVYLPWFRNALPPMVREFDGANPSFSISQRNRSTVATQALAMMNNPWVRDRAKALLESVTDAQQNPDQASQSDKIRVIFRRILGRQPDESELLWAHELLTTSDLEELAHQLFASIDFRYAP